MTAPARSIAFDVLCRVSIEGGYSDYACNAPDVARLQARDRNLVTEIVYGTLRWQGWLDFLLSRVSARGWEEIDPRVGVLLRMSLYQISRLERIPAYAAVHEAVEIARARVGHGAGRFVNAILRRLARERPWQAPGLQDALPETARVSLPEWLWRRWAARFGTAQALAYARSLLDPPPRYVRLRASGLKRPETLGALELSDVVPGAVLERGDAPAGTEAGAPQDEASQLIPHLLGALEGCLLWDACAAPGGKTAILLALAGERGRVVASDLHEARARHLRAAAGGAASSALDVVVADATQAPFRARFDAALADVPCSGLGTLRRNPEIKWRLRPEELPRLAALQGGILQTVAGQVRPGGLVLYSTCSTEPEENDGVVLSFLATTRGFRLVRPTAPPGIDAWTDGQGFVRTYPSTRGWDGFFAALIARNS